MKAKARIINCQCGNTFQAGFTSGVIPDTILCTHCKKTCNTNGTVRKHRKEKTCPGCSRPVKLSESKACLYCGWSKIML